MNTLNFKNFLERIGIDPDTFDEQEVVVSLVAFRKAANQQSEAAGKFRKIGNEVTAMTKSNESFFLNSVANILEEILKIKKELDKRTINE